MSAVANAFQQAGYRPARERLRESAENAWRGLPEGGPVVDAGDVFRLKVQAMEAVIKSEKNWDRARGALMRAVRHDADLLWAMFEPYFAKASQKVLSEASNAAHKKDRVGQPRGETHAKTADSLRDVGRVDGENRPVLANVTHPGPARPSAARKPESLSVVSVITRKSMLDTMMINGVPLGDCTPNQARTWARYRKLDHRFVELLTSNLPPNDPIRNFIDGESAQELYERAKKEAFGE